MTAAPERQRSTGAGSLGRRLKIRMSLQPGFVARIGFENSFEAARNDVREILGAEESGIPAQFVEDANFKPNGQGLFLRSCRGYLDDGHGQCSLLG
jgi:hypothetical protein